MNRPGNGPRSRLAGERTMRLTDVPRSGGARSGRCGNTATSHRSGIARLATAHAAVLGLLSILVAGCAAPRNPLDWASIHEVTPPFLASMASTDPSVAADGHGRVALAFVTRDSAGANVWLSVSRDSGSTFTEPVRLNERLGGVRSSPASPPQVVLGPGASVAVAWTEATGRDSSSFMVRASRDGGLSLAAPAEVGRTRTRDDEPTGGSITFLDDGSLFAAWLADAPMRAGADAGGRASAPPGDDVRAPYLALAPDFETPRPEIVALAALYAAHSPDGGRRWSPPGRLADSACACAPAVMAGPEGFLAVAFQRARGMLRAPALVISRDGGRSFEIDTSFSHERWAIETCPRQGLALEWRDARGGLVAWTPVAGDRGVRVATWRLEGGAAAPPLPVADDLAAVRHPRLSRLGAATLIAAEARPRETAGHSVLAVRVLDPDGSLTPWCFLGADAEAGGVAGINGHTGVACWTEREGEAHRARVVTLRRRAG